MKKILLSIYIVLAFLFCFICSMFVKKVWDISGDYLTAFTTLVAALVAFHLYTDWKVEHKFKLLEQHQNALKIHASNLYTQYLEAVRNLSSIEGSTVANGELKFKDGALALENIKNNLNKTRYVIAQYFRCLNSFDDADIISISRDQLNDYVIKFSNMHLAYITLSVKSLNGASGSADILSVIKDWGPIIMSFSNYCELELTDLYFELLEINS